jgi:DNA-binding transcriptional ArsR family regulator
MKLWRMFILPILAQRSVFILRGLRVACYRFYRLVHPGRDGVDVFAQVLDDRLPVRASSNAQLSVRAHGISGTTLRRHLGALVDAGLIVRKDSANGKRYARKDKLGEIEDTYGLDLSPCSPVPKNSPCNKSLRSAHGFVA